MHVVRLLRDLGTDNDLFLCHHDLGIVGLLPLHPLALLTELLSNLVYGLAE